MVYQILDLYVRFSRKSCGVSISKSVFNEVFYFLTLLHFNTHKKIELFDLMASIAIFQENKDETKIQKNVYSETQL